MLSLSGCFHAFVLASLASVNGVAAKSFIIKNDTFLKDGMPLNLRSGSLHYFRIPPAYWRDRIQRMKALGLNSVTLYVAWNYHEEVEGEYHRMNEVTDFLDVIKQEGMLAILRPGPYICGEWEFGGFPAYLLSKKGIKLRTWNHEYISAVDRWLNELYPRLSSYIYSKDGPIVMIQIENEYGSFGDCGNNPDDAKYMNHLLDRATMHFGTNVLYNTIDGGEGTSAASLEAGNPWKGDSRVLATVDGGLDTDYSSSFRRQKAFNAPGYSPKMWTELWVGWFTVWADSAMAGKTSSNFRSGVGEMVKENASFSLYMAHGGTNFGFWSGANGDPTVEGKGSYQPDVTSYDYSSPISEAGDHNVGSDGKDLFAAVQSAIADKYGALPQEPQPIAKTSYGKIELTESASFFQNLGSLSSCSSQIADGSQLPSMESLGQAYGMLLYRSIGSFEAQSLSFSSKSLHDRVQVFVHGREMGTAYRAECPSSVKVVAGDSMDLLVENMGRINYGQGLYDYKGLLTSPPVSGNWSAVCIPLKSAQIQALPFSSLAPSSGPIFRRGYFSIDGAPKDTFLNTLGFTKGYIWMNGHALGRYWETAGPQHTLYVPAPLLQSGRNEVIVFDLHGSLASTISSVASPQNAHSSGFEAAANPYPTVRNLADTMVV